MRTILSWLKIIIIAMWALLLSMVAMVLILVDRSFTSYFWLARLFGRGVLAVSGIQLRVTGLENVSADKVYVFVSNHSSMYDIPALQIAFPGRAVIVFKKELARIPVFGWQLKWGPYIIIDRQNPESAMRSIERAKQTMTRNNASVLLFAEGTRSKDGTVQPFKRGAFYLGAKVGFPMVPVSVSGTAAIMPKGKFVINPGVISVHFDKPLLTTGVSNKQDELRLMEEVRSVVINNLKG